MNEDVYVVHGKTYEARPELLPPESPQACRGCAFNGKASHAVCRAAPQCSSVKRQDKRNIIWVEVQA